MFFLIIYLFTVIYILPLPVMKSFFIKFFYLKLIFLYLYIVLLILKIIFKMYKILKTKTLLRNIG